MEVEPEKENISPEQRTEKRADGIPAVEIAREIAQMPYFPAHLVKEQGQRSPGKNHWKPHHHQEKKEAEHVVETEGCGLIPEETAQEVGPIGRVLELPIEQQQ